jgi:hypothetical protein
MMFLIKSDPNPLFLNQFLPQILPHYLHSPINLLLLLPPPSHFNLEGPVRLQEVLVPGLQSLYLLELLQSLSPSQVKLRLPLLNLLHQGLHARCKIHKKNISVSCTVVELKVGVSR